MTATRRWTGRVLDASFAGLLAVSMATFILGRVLPLVGHPTLVVAGGSMEPAIGVGSAIVLETVDPRSLRPGDVVSLTSGPNRAIWTHRIVRIVERDGQPWLETMGDANAAADPSISPAANVIGRVALSLPLAGFAVAVLSNPAGILSVASLAMAILLARSMLVPSLRERGPSPGRRLAATG